MEFPTITVILPTRDRPACLREAVASVFSQSVLPSELLVVDDSLSGGAEEALLPLLSEAPCPVRMLRGDGRGPGAARNVGLRAAVGELVAFLDDDDVWAPEKLSRQGMWFVRRAGLGVLGTEVLREASGVRGQGSGTALVHAEAPDRLRIVSRTALLRANRLATSSVLARRCALEACGGFDESLPLAQDWDLWLRVAPRWEIGVLAAELVTYRLHAAQRSARCAEMRECESQVVRRAMEEESGWRRGVARRRLSWARCRLGRARLRERAPARAAQAAREAIALYPLNLVAWGTLARARFAATALSTDLSDSPPSAA